MHVPCSPSNSKAGQLYYTCGAPRLNGFQPFIYVSKILDFKLFEDRIEAVEQEGCFPPCPGRSYLQQAGF